MPLLYGNWEDLFTIKLPEDIIRVKTEYQKNFTKFIENVLNVSISFLYIFVKNSVDKFLMEISVYITDSNVIKRLKKLKSQNSLLFKDYSDLFSKDPDLFLKLTILKDDLNHLKINKSKVSINFKGSEEKVISYFSKIVELYFEEFVKKATIEVVNLTRAKHPITEKGFIKKYSYLIDSIIKESKEII